MRRLYLILLFCLLSFPILAQEDYAMPQLPETLLMAESDILLSLEPNQFAWLDNENLVFTFSNMSDSYSAESSYLAYSYNLATGDLVELEDSPFVADWDEERRAFYNSGDNIVHRSPYPDDDGEIPVLYQNGLRTECDWQCEGGSFVLYGNYHTEDEESGTVSYPLPTLSSTGFNVHWSRNNHTVLMESGNDAIAYVSLSYVQFSSREMILIPFGLTNVDYDHAFGIAPDGSRVAFAADESFVLITDSSPEAWQKLIIWDAPRHDDACVCTYDPVSHLIYSEEDNDGKNFVGVGFVDEDTILYIGNEGMFSYSISTGESTLIDPAFNAHWINIAIFSPDNRHLAVTTETGLYVLPTGL